MASLLTNGSIYKIFNERDVDSLIFQVLNVEDIHSRNHDIFRFRISDGTHYSDCCMVGSLLYGIAENVMRNSIIKVNRYACNQIKENRKVAIILDFDVLDNGERHIIGNPTQFETNYYSRSSTSNNIQQEIAEPMTKEFNEPSTSTFNRGSFDASQKDSSFVGGSSSVDVDVQPITTLIPNLDKWTICARVINKSAISSKKQFEEDGKLFTMDLLDETGEIRAVAFDQECDKFYNMIEVDKVYYITGGNLRFTDKRYNSLKNDFQINFSYRTKVTLCQRETNISYLQYNFIGIDQLEDFKRDTFVDVIGICKEIAPVSTVTGKTQKKRDIQIFDKSWQEVRLTLWGPQADFDGSLNSIIAIKGAKVANYNGKCLSVLSSSTMQVNPDIKETHELRVWYANNSRNLQVENFFKREGDEGTFDNLKLISEVVAGNVERIDQAAYYIKSTLVYLEKENCLYTACPSEGCNKKVVDMNGVYRCLNCFKEYTSYNWGLELQAYITDETAIVCVTLYQDEAEKLLECTADNLAVMKESDENAFQASFISALFSEYLFKLRVQIENDGKSKVIVASVEKLS